jgi:pimeloyl-ACP methyl ester carboxylesterase/uncharacterized protein YneF (UPF0154 family)
VTVVSILWMLCVFLAAGVLLVWLAVREMRTMLLRPPRMTETKALRILQRIGPDDVGIAAFEEIPFRVYRGDESPERAQTLQIKSFWMPHPDPRVTRTCVLIHGFADSRVGALAWAPVFRDAGCHLLAIDLRAHGESDGTMTTGGFFERDDVASIVEQLRTRFPDATKQVILFGASLGGATALACAAKHPELIAGVVTDSVFAHYAKAAANHARLIAAPMRSLQPYAIRAAERACGARFDEVAPLVTLPKLACPALLIHGTRDPFVPMDDVEALSSAIKSRNNPRDAMWVVEDAYHVLSLHAQPDEYARRVRAFVESLAEDERPLTSPL